MEVVVVVTSFPELSKVDAFEVVIKFTPEVVTGFVVVVISGPLVVLTGLGSHCLLFITVPGVSASQPSS